MFLVVCVHIKRCKVDFLCFSYGDHYRGLENYLTFHSDGGEPKLISRTVVCVSRDVEKSSCYWVRGRGASGLGSPTRWEEAGYWLRRVACQAELVHRIVLWGGDRSLSLHAHLYFILYILDFVFWKTQGLQYLCLSLCQPHNTLVAIPNQAKVGMHLSKLFYVFV